VAFFVLLLICLFKNELSNLVEVLITNKKLNLFLVNLKLRIKVEQLPSPYPLHRQKTKYLDCCESTNLLGFQEALNADVPEGFAWIAGQQTSGKGQRGNVWHAQANQNLLVSYLLKPDHKLLSSQFYLSKAAAIGIIQGIQNWATENLGETLPLAIKWPNDIYLDGHKLGGILIESNFQSGKWAYSILGLGLNINQMEFEGMRATSLRKWTQNPQSIDISTLFNYVSVGIEKATKNSAIKHFSKSTRTTIANCSVLINGIHSKTKMDLSKAKLYALMNKG